MRNKLPAYALTIAALAALSAPAAAQNTTTEPVAPAPATVGGDVDDEGFDYGWLGLLGLLGLAGLSGRRRHADTVSTVRTTDRH